MKYLKYMLITAIIVYGVKAMTCELDLEYVSIQEQRILDLRSEIAEIELEIKELQTEHKQCIKEEIDQTLEEL